MNAPGIERLGVHVPLWSLDRRELATNWSTSSGKGSRAVANYDEDAITMGVEAALAALGPDLDAGAAEIDAVLFATSTPVFTEKQHAAVVATALRIPATICLDVTGSLRAGIDAVRMATALVRAGEAARVLVVAADRRDLPPGSAHERVSGDAGAAVVVGTRRPLATIAGQGTVIDPAAGVWRLPADTCTRVADDRFVTTELLTPWLADAVLAASSDAGVLAAQVDAGLLAAPLPRVESAVASRFGWAAPDNELGDAVGYAGVAHPFLQLALALPARQAGEQILVAAAGDGASALVLTVGESPDSGAAAAHLRASLERRRPLAVGMYQRMRGQLPVEPVSPFTSEMLMRREQSTGLELRGCRCSKCSRAHFPPRRICLECGAADLMEAMALSRSGTLFTHTVEHLFPVPVNHLIMGVVEVDDVRVYTQVTDTDPDDCAPGRPVVLVLRRLHDGGHVPHYFWKAKVVDEASAR